MKHKKVEDMSWEEVSKPLREAKKKIREKDVPDLIHRMREDERQEEELKNNIIVKIVRLGKGGQITIPKIIRDKADWKVGDTLLIIRTPGGTIILEKGKRAGTAREVYGMFKGLKIDPQRAKDEMRKSWD